MLRFLVIPYLIIEILLIYIFIEEYGFLKFIFEVILSAFIGLFIILNFGFLNFTNQIKILKPSNLLSNFGLAFGGFLLFLPGILSDICAISIIVVSFILNFKSSKNDEFYENTYNNTQNNIYNEDEIIDVEIIEEDKNG